MALVPVTTTRALWFTFGAAAFLVVCAAARLPVIPDEAYYWTWAQSPALAYFDHPPGVALVLAATAAILGDAWPGLRAASMASMALVAILSAASARRLVPAPDRPRATQLALLVLAGAPMFIIGCVPLTPDPLHAAVTAFAAYCAVRAFEGEARSPSTRAALWAAASSFSLVVAVGFKHYAALVAAGAFVGMLVTPEGRAVAARPATWVGVLAGAVLLLPWLVADGGGSFGFQAGRVFAAGPDRGVVALPLMMGSLAGTLGPVSAGVLLAAGLKRGRAEPPVGRVLAGGALALLAGCLVAVWLGGGEANWPLPSLVFALPLIVSSALTRPRLALAMRAIGVVSLWAMLAGLAHAAWPFLPIPPRRDPTARGHGWAAVAAEVERQAALHDARFVIARRYQPASLLRYHLRDRREVLELGTPSGRKSQYDLWPRPSACAGDIAVVAGPGERLPPEVTGARLSDPVQVDRTYERWWVQTVRLDRDLASCRTQR